MFTQTTLGVLIACSLALLSFSTLQAEEPANRFALGDEATFLATAGEGWYEVAPSIWERNVDGVVTRVGFGRQSFEFALERARQKRDGLSLELEVSPDDLQLRQLALTLDAEIQYLEEALERGRDEIVTKGTSSESGSACGGTYEIEATASAPGYTGGSGTAESRFTQVGPFSPSTKTLFASVTATSTRGTDSDWMSGEAQGCCSVVNASASINGTLCEVTSQAYIQGSDGCTDYHSVSQYAACQEIEG